MTDIAIHAHAGVRWVSWHMGRAGFSRIHLERPGLGKTLCDVYIPTVGRVVRDQHSAAIEDLCKSCLKSYAAHHEDTNG